MLANTTRHQIVSDSHCVRLPDTYTSSRGVRLVRSGDESPVTQRKERAMSLTQSKFALLISLGVVLSLALMTSAASAMSWHDVSSPSALIAKLTQQRCPDGFRFSASGSTIYCLKSKLALPKAKITADCDTLEEGRMAYTWPPSKKTKAYQCPEGSTLKKRKGAHACVFDGLFVPKNVNRLKPYCQYLSKGYFGYSYSL